MQKRLPKLTSFLGVVASIGLTSLPADAQDAGRRVNLLDQNSLLNLNLQFTVGSDQPFVFEDEWSVDGRDHLFQEGIFFNLGENPQTPDTSLLSFDFVSDRQTTSNQYSVVYSGFDNQLQFQYDLTLTGGTFGSGLSRRSETMTLQNLSDQVQTVYFYHYIDLDLESTYANDTLFYLGGQFTQIDPEGAIVTVASEQIPDAIEMDGYPTLVERFFLDNAPTFLDNDATPIINGDATFAMQFRRVLQPQESIAFNFVKQLRHTLISKQVPEPTSILATLAAASGLFLTQRKR